MRNELLLPGERLDDLQRDGLQLIQNPSRFCFGMDAVLLARFARVRKDDRVMDLCSGNGIIPVLMAGTCEGGYFTGLEIQEDVADMAKRSVGYNHLEDKVKIVVGDIKEASSTFGAASFDVVTCNPPYMTGSHGLVNPLEEKAIARHEILCSLDDVIREGNKGNLVGYEWYPYLFKDNYKKESGINLDISKYKIKPENAFYSLPPRLRDDYPKYKKYIPDPTEPLNIK